MELSFDEAGNFFKSLQEDGRYPRSQSRVGLLVDSELDRAVLLECKAASGLKTEWKFFDNLDRACRWAGQAAAPTNHDGE